MKLSRLLLLFLIALFVLFCIGFFQPVAFEANSRPHHLLTEDIPANTLLESKGGYGDKPGVIILGYAILVVMLGIMGIAVLTGLKKYGKSGPWLSWIVAGFVLYALVFLGLTLSYWDYTQGNTDTYLGGYPAPTAWMIYGVWFFPVLIAALLILKFDQWFLTEDDLQAFRQLLEERKAMEGGEEA